MTLDELRPLLKNVTPQGSRERATCPAHADTNPSLQITAGERGLLLKCWSGCSLEEICHALGIKPQNLFYDALDPNPSRRREAAQQRDQTRQVREREAQRQGLLIDVLREADRYVQSRRGFDISTWNHERLDSELDALASAYRLLGSEEYFHG